MRPIGHRIGWLFKLQFEVKSFSLSMYMLRLVKLNGRRCSEMLRHHLLEHEGPMFLGGKLNCTLAPRLNCSFVSPPGRHDSLALRRLLDQAQLCDVLEDDMERVEEERAISAFHATAHTNSTLCLVANQQVLDLTGST